jgi:hypothetical protein
MTKRILARAVAVAFLLSMATGCAVRPVVDPRNPAPVRDGPVSLRVCFVQDDGAHLAVGDRVELATSKLGRLRIRHLAANANTPAWNGGDDAAVRDAVLVEQLVPRGEAKNTRRFVPVGRFGVQLPDSSHVKFDFLASKAVSMNGEPIPGCNVPLGTDVVMIRGAEDQARHGGHAILVDE